MAMLCFILTVFIGCIVSKLIRPMFLTRYMYVAVGLLFLGISIGIAKSNYKNLLRLIIINIPFIYEQVYKKEYKNGTEEFKKIVKETIKNEQISSDIEKLNWTILAYYCPNNKLLKYIDTNTRGYIITSKDKKILEKIIPNTKIEFIYKGNIDNQ